MKNLCKRIVSLALMLVLLPHIAPKANAAATQTVTIANLTYTITVTSATDRHGNNILNKITDIGLNQNNTSRTGNTVKIWNMTLYGFGTGNSCEFTDSDCKQLQPVSKEFVTGNDNIGYTKVVVTITRPAAEHTGGTCTNPVCTRCGKTYDAPHDYKWKSNGTNHWQECTRDATHPTINYAACSGGTATCKTLATCSTCKNSYGNLNPDNHEWSEWEHTGYTMATRHFRTCDCREGVREIEDCNPLPNCTQGSICSKCGTPYPIDDDNHNWGGWQSNGDGTHTRTCTLNGSHKETQNCSGDANATCTTTGTCTTCGSTYKNLNSHNYTYSASGNIIIETCANGCGHRATATLKANDVTYTGSDLTPATIAYDEGWKGSRVDDSAIVYTNNRNASTATDKATAEVTIEGHKLTTTFKVNPADLSGATVLISPAAVRTYTGSALTPGISVSLAGYGTLTGGVDYTVAWEKNGFTLPDDYKVAVEGVGNFKGTAYNIYTINPATLTGVNVQAAGLTYANTALRPPILANATAVDGSAVTFTYSTLSDGTYGELPYFTDAGTYTVYYKASAPNHYDATGSFTVRINQAANEWETPPTIADWTYGQPASTPAAQAKFGAFSVRYIGTANDGTAWDSEAAPTLAGQYTAVFTVEATNNHTGLREEVDFTVNKADYDLSAAKWNYTDAFTYDGSEKSVAVTGLPAEVTVVSYTGERATAKGSYTARVTLAGADIHNYNVPAMEELNWRIKAAPILQKAGGAPDTGDGAALLPWSGMAMFGLLSAAALVFGRKRSRS